jgi:hypothetical protein
MIYVASSWRNEHQQRVVRELREANLSTYDFRNPSEGLSGFSWSSIDPDWKRWTTDEFIAALGHTTADKGFMYDMHALHECDACLLVLPCGRSAHLEAGYAAGHNKPLVIYIPEPGEPELMYAMADLVTNDLSLAVGFLKGMFAQSIMSWNRQRWAK